MTRRKLWLEQFVNTVAIGEPSLLALPPRQQPVEAAKVFVETVGRIPIASSIDRDNMFNVAMFCKKFSYGGAKIYKIAERFGEHLGRTNLDVPTAALPVKDGASYCIEFPDGMQFQGESGEYWRTAIVGVGTYLPGLKTPKLLEEDEELPEGAAPLLFLTLPDYDKDGKFELVSSFFSFPLSFETLEECVENLERRRKSSLNFPRQVFNYLVKCLLYIESGEPDLQPEAGFQPTTKKPKKLRRQNEEFCRFDIVRVGYSFHERLRHVDQTTVAGHFRWQPYGPQRSQVKLIWIDEHERHYTKNDL